MIRKNRVHGSSLLYVLMLILIISTLLSAYILLNARQRSWLDRIYGAELARENMYAGMSLLLAEPFHLGESRAYSLFDSAYDSAYLQTSAWGTLGLVQASGFHADEMSQQWALIGQVLSDKRKASLFLDAQKQPLVIVGKTALRGTIYLPATGVKKGSVGRRKYEGEKLIYGTRKSSSEQMLKVDYSLWSHIQDTLLSIQADTVQEEYYYIRKVSHHQPWEDDEFEIRSQHSLIVDQSSFSGKCQIVTSGDIIIEADSELDHTLLYGRRIYIEKGFKGNCQAFALERIEVAPEVSLTYPSVLAVLKGNKEPAHIHLNHHTELEGALLYHGSLIGGEKHREDYVWVDSTSVLWGLADIPYQFELEGTVYGHVHTKQFLLRTPGAIYKNYLLDVTLDASKLDPSYAAPFIDPQVPSKIIQWL